MIEEAKQKEILEMSEIDTFFLIDEAGAFMWRMNHEMAHGRIPAESHAGSFKARFLEAIPNSPSCMKQVIEDPSSFSVAYHLKSLYTFSYIFFRFFIKME